MLGETARSLECGCNACAEGAEDAATARDGHQAPSNKVVDAHEVSGRVLDHSALSKGEFFHSPGVIGGLVAITSSELTDSVEPPDDSSDPPGQAAAAKAAASEAREAHA